MGLSVRTSGAFLPLYFLVSFHHLIWWCQAEEGL